MSNNLSNGFVTNSIKFDSPVRDAFGRGRQSNAFNIFDSKQIIDNQPLIWDDVEVSGSGTSSTYDADRSSSLLAVSATTAGLRVRQTKLRFNYQPGKSQLILLTGIMGDNVSGVTKRLGLMDDENGLYFELDGTNFAVVRRTKTSGSVVENKTTQANFNIDKVDGTGKSRVLFDPTKGNIFIMDFQWLGLGRIRYGIYEKGEIIYIHEDNSANKLDSVFMTTPNLPLRYEIENDGTGAATNLEAVCTTIISEGGSAAESGIIRYVSNEGTAINANALGVVYAVLGIRLKSAALDTIVKLKRISVIASTNVNFEWLLLLNPTLDNAITFNDQTNSGVQTGVGNAGDPSTSTISSVGTIIDGGYQKSSGGGSSIFADLPNSLYIGSTVDGTRDELYLAVRPLAADLDIHGAIAWQEIT